jgi:hypothetical protein
MNLSDAQGRLARWRLRLAEFTFKVEYHPDVAYHTAYAMSRLPHQAVPSDPIEEEIPVCAVAHEESQEPEFPTALEEVTSDPITEIPILHRGVRIFDSANSNFEKVEKFDSNSANSNSNWQIGIRFARIVVVQNSFMNNSKEWSNIRE